MKKIIFLLLFNLTILNAYTLILKDNSIIKGELIKVNDNYTLISINGEETVILNKLIKKRFYTPAELALIEKNKLSINNESKVNSLNKLTTSNEEIYGIKNIKKENNYSNKQKNKTAKFNLYINYDSTTQLNSKSTFPNGEANDFSNVSKQDPVLGIGVEYNDVLYGKTKYSLGGLMHLERKIDLGKYSGSYLYARIEHPFIENDNSYYTGIELNYFFATITEFSSTFVNIKPSPTIGYGIYQRKYFKNFFLEGGVRQTILLADSYYIVGNLKTNLNHLGFYFLIGMSF